MSQIIDEIDGLILDDLGDIPLTEENRQKLMFWFTYRFPLESEEVE